MAAELTGRTDTEWVGPRLSDALFQKARSGFASYAAISSNVKAIEASLMFANGLAPFVALVGPSGWGKSHLLEGAASVIRRDLGITAKVLSAAQWVEAGARWDQQGPLILDDAQGALARSRLRQAVRNGLERRVQAGRPTMLAFTAPRLSRSIRGFLPGIRDWHMATISIPTPNERELVSRQIASLEGLTLSNAIFRFISRQMSWDGNAILGAMRRLKLVQTRWVETDEVLRGLGILGPYLVDNSGCDLRDQVHETVSRVVDQGEHTDDKVNLTTDLSVYLMIDRMGLSEGEVASYFRLSPGEAYCRAQKMARQDRATCQRLKADCAKALVASLD
ncbi:MAG: hypothetical protein K1X67_21725 [Fimbriimonadaceae bacterium]|nr:hypothetical protein [Fimbriimonadaceae bacterium]